MQQLKISEEEVSNIFDKILDTNLYNKNEKALVNNISEYVNKLFNSDSELIFTSRFEINEICKYIDEQIEFKGGLISEEFKNEINNIRVQEYINIVLKSSKRSKKDTFLLKNEERISKANEFLQNNIEYSKTLTEDYFTIENITEDLQKFANTTDTKKIEDLHTSNPVVATKIKINKGVNISWQVYLNTVSLMFLNEDGKLSDSFKFLKDKINITKLDNAYFLTKDNVKKDLEGYIEKVDGGDINITPLNIIKKQNPSIEITNGENIKFNKYLKEAKKVLIKNEEQKYENGDKQIFDKLKEIAGFSFENITEDFSEIYFNNPQNIQYDLELFSKMIKSDSEKEIINININNISKTRKITTKSGRNIGFYMYISEASRHIFETEINKPKFKETIEYLKKLIGIIPLGIDYYYNKEYLEKDLSLFLKKSKDINSIYEMTPSNPKNSSKVKISNGKIISWKAYLSNYSKHILLTKIDRPKLLDSLNGIKEIIN